MTEDLWDAVESYDPDTDSWDGSAPMSHARFDAKAATVMAVCTCLAVKLAVLKEHYLL